MAATTFFVWLALASLIVCLIARRAGQQVRELERRVAALERLRFDPHRPADGVAVAGYTGPWPPAAGTIMPAGFPEDLLAAARLLYQAPQKRAAAVEIQPADGSGVGTFSPGKRGPQVLALGRRPDGDRFAGAQLDRQGRHAQRINDDGHALAEARPASANPARGGQTNAVDGDFGQTQVCDADAQPAIRIPGDAVCEFGGDGAWLTAAEGTQHPHGSDAQADAIALHGPEGVDDTQHRAKYGQGQSQASTPVVQSAPPSLRTVSVAALLREEVH